MNPSFIFLLLLISALLPFLVKSPKLIVQSAVAFAVLSSCTLLYIIAPILLKFGTPVQGLWWNVDMLGSFMALLIAFVYVMGSFVSARYVYHEYEEKIFSIAELKLYFFLLPLFVLSMLLVALTNNILLLWVALEGTTLSTTFLVGIYKKDASIEAAWKYILLCSTGITLGLLGILMTVYAARIGGLSESIDLFSLTSLQAQAHALNPDIMRWAFIFVFIGLGTKVGFVPMHTWLPDAHSRAPSPISAMLSGVLLNVALYAILRFKFLTDASLGNANWTNRFFLVFGLLSVLVPAFILLIQRNYKRMLAYSSVEHMGLIALGIGLGPLGMVAAFMHMLGHTLTKSFLFFGAGEILLKWKTTKIANIRSLLRLSPYTGIFFLLGILCILAFPPTALFASEFTLFRAGFAVHPLLSLVVIASLTLIAVGMIRTTLTMFAESTKSEVVSVPEKKETWNSTHTVLFVQLVLIVALGIFFLTSSGVEYISSLIPSFVLLP